VFKIDKLLIYLIFNGECREALNFYEKSLGGKIKSLTSFAESPLTVSEENFDLIFDSELQADNIIIKASDSLPENNITVGNNFSLFLVFSNLLKLEKFYKDISDGGKIIIPLPIGKMDTKFAMIKDKYDIQWMLAYNP
jgi:PhnB protein